MNKSEKKIQNRRAAARRSCEPPQADGSMRFYRMHQFWELADGLPVKKVRLKELDGFDEVRWFGGPRNILPTCRAIAEHARDIYEADLNYPIILSPDGEVLDGWHRICKAFVEGIEELDAVQLTTMPPYRWRVLLSGEEVEISEGSDGAIPIVDETKHEMSNTAERVAQRVEPLLRALAALDSVAAVVCFGSYASGTADAESDIDLYVICEPTIIPETARRGVLESLPGVSDVEVRYVTPGWDNPWAPESDRVRVEGIRIELSYNTLHWITQVVDQVVAHGALTLPQMPFRPYTVLGLIAHSLPLYDRQGSIQNLRTCLNPYPAVLKRRLIENAVPIMLDGLVELRDYAQRNIGPGSFLFHLGRVSDAIEQILYAVNEHYDPATKRSEHELAKLAVAPAGFVGRLVRILEGPFDHKGRLDTVDELTDLVGEVRQLAEHALA